jgi:hypothetical protein
VEPSVKGSLVLGAVVTLRRHRKQGRVTPEQLAARLGGPALELIDQKIDIARWYPIDAFCQLLDADWEMGGNRDPDYMRRQGVLAADRLFDSGIYQQLHYAENAEAPQSRDALRRQAKLITTITATLYNFLRFDVRLDPARADRLEIVYDDAAPFSEALRLTTEGFMNQINVRQGSQRRWTSERERPERIVFRMQLPSRFRDGS